MGLRRTSGFNGHEHLFKHRVQCGLNTCWVSWTSLWTVYQDYSLWMVKSLCTKTTALPQKARCMVGLQRGQSQEEGERISRAAQWLTESPRLSVVLGMGLFGAVLKARLFNHDCVHLLGRVFHLCIQPFAVWDSLFHKNPLSVNSHQSCKIHEYQGSVRKSKDC